MGLACVRWRRREQSLLAWVVVVVEVVLVMHGHVGNVHDDAELDMLIMGCRQPWEGPT